MPREDIVDMVVSLVEPLLNEKGLELVHLDFRAGKKSVLRFYIDKPGGVGLVDCERASRDISDILDAYDPIPNSYMLEVSSPGLDRPLVKEKDYIRFLGEKVTIHTSEPLEGRRKFRGILAEKEGEFIVIIDDGSRITIPLDKIQKANVIYAL